MLRMNAQGITSMTAVREDTGAGMIMKMRTPRIMAMTIIHTEMELALKKRKAKKAITRARTKSNTGVAMKRERTSTGILVTKARSIALTQTKPVLKSTAVENMIITSMTTANEGTEPSPGKTLAKNSMTTVASGDIVVLWINT